MPAGGTPRHGSGPGRVHRSVAALALALVLPAASLADRRDCARGIAVDAPTDAMATRICTDAVSIRDQLASCGLTVPHALSIKVVPDLGESCLGLYHCGERRIELMPPEAYPDRLNPASPFTVISEAAFFTSVLRHEMAHAALDAMPCPFDSCIGNQEYVAYTTQIMFLPPDDLAAFEAHIAYDRPIRRDELNPIMLFMAPEIYVQKAWLHLQQRPDPCAFIGQVSRAEVLFDVERP